MVEWFAKSQNVVSQVLRVGHVYGPGEEKYMKVIPVMLRNAIFGKNIQQFGDGEEFRSFIYITDVVEAIIKAIELDEYVGPINIVSEEKIRIRELIAKIISISKKDLTIEKKEVANPPRNLVFDNSKMKEYLITPGVKLDEGLKIEYDYFRELLIEDIF